MIRLKHIVLHLIKIHLLIIGLFFTSSPLVANTAADPIDSLALVALYQATDGANWNSPWVLSDSVTKWEGVQLDLNGDVISIDLRYNNLVGSLPTTLGNLSELQILLLDGNQLSGAIPASIATLSRLVILTLNNNQLYSVDASFTASSPINFFFLDSNQLTFEDILPIITGHPSINRLDYAMQDSVGSLLSHVANIGENYLLKINIDDTVSSNQYQWFKDGVLLQTVVGNNELLLENLTRIDAGVYSCKITNPNAPQLTLNSQPITVTVVCRAIDSLALVEFYNDFDGDNWFIPWDLDQPMDTWTGIGLNSGCVDSIRLVNNGLEGELVEEISQLSELRYLELVGEDISGALPSTIGDITTLRVLRVYNTTISEIPLEINNLDSLEELNLSNNELSALPALNMQANLGVVNVNHNQLTFDALLPSQEMLTTYAPQDSFLIAQTFVFNTTESDTIYLGIDDTVSTNVYNWFRNDVPYTTITGINWLEFPSITLADSGVYRCEVSNPFLPDLTLFSRSVTVVPTCSRTDSLALVALYDSTNQELPWDLTMPYHTWEGIATDPISGCVTAINLPNKGLSGSLPTEIGNLIYLEKLNLSQNQLSSTLPSSIGNLVALDTLQLQINNLSGSLPTRIGQLTALKQLLLFNNQFGGALPTSLYTLSTLRELQLQNNNFTGLLSASINGLVNISLLRLHDNNFVGPIPQEIGSLTRLKRLWLHDNTFLGTIPEELGNLDSLELLDLGNNFLSGELPDSLYNLINLTRLNLSNNRLIGELIPELSQLSQLENLFLAQNDFSGDIPNAIGSLTSLIRLDLSDNQFESIPNTIQQLINLEELNISKNQISVLANLSGISSLKYGLQIQDNQLSFDDIIPNMSLLEDSINHYAPQDSVGTTTQITLEIENGYAIVLPIDQGITTNTYTWLLESTILTTNTINIYAFNKIDLEDAGTYTATITNPLVPGLTLYSRPTTITVTTPSPFNLIIGDVSKTHTIHVPEDVISSISSNELQIGDWIGIFFKDENDSLQCGGHGAWREEELNIKVYQDDITTVGIKDGFDIGDAFTVVIYQYELDSQLTVTAEYDVLNCTGNGTFSVADTSCISSLFLCQVFSKTLQAGWHLFSIPILPNDLSLDSIFYHFDNALLKTETGQAIFIKENGITLISINDWDTLKGYKLFTPAVETFKVCGIPLNPQTLIDLPQNSYPLLIPYFGQNSALIEAALTQISNSIDYVQVLEYPVGATSPIALNYIPMHGINEIGLMKPGLAYKFMMKSSVQDFQFPINVVNRYGFHAINQRTIPKHFHNSSLRETTNAILVIPTILLNTSIEKGDEIGVFDQENKLVGASTFDRGNISITIWKDNTQTTDKDGLLEEEEFKLRLWSAQEEQEYEVDATFNLPSTFKTNQLFVSTDFQVKVVNNLEVEKPSELLLYPNPSKSEFTIESNLSQHSIDAIKIYNQLGQKFYQWENINSGQFLKRKITILDWPKGIYFVEIETTNGQQVKRLMIK